MTSLRIAVAAAAVAVVAIVGINLLPDQGFGPGPASVPSPTPTLTSSPTATPAPSTATVPNPGIELAPGTYLIHDPFPLRVSLTVGEGWTSWSGNVVSGAGIYKDSPDPPGGFGVVVAVVDNVYADPCDASKGLLDPTLGGSVDELVDALSSQPRTEASSATDVTLDGYSGKYLEYTATVPTAECSRTLSRWPTVVGAREALASEHDRVWILDVDGVRLVIDAFSFRETTAADLAEARAIVESIQIEP